MDNGLRDKRILAKVRIPIFQGFVRRLQRENRFFEENSDLRGDCSDRRCMVETRPLRRLKIGRVDA